MPTRESRKATPATPCLVCGFSEVGLISTRASAAAETGSLDEMPPVVVDLISDDEDEQEQAKSSNGEASQFYQLRDDVKDPARTWALSLQEMLETPHKRR